MTDLNIRDLENSLEISRQNSDIPGQLQTLSQLGQAYQAKRQYQKALTYSRQALDMVKDQASPDDRIIARVNMGCVYWEMAQLKKAMALFQDALPIAEEIGDDAGQRMLCAIMGISCWRKGEWSKAFDWFEQALPACLEGEIESDPSQSVDLRKYEGLRVVMERGVATLKNRVRIAQDQHDPTRILLPSFSMVPLLFFTGRKGEIPHLLEEIVPLAQQLKKDKILDAIPALRKLMGSD